MLAGMLFFARELTTCFFHMPPFLAAALVQAVFFGHSR
ncbi:hypothetical protein B4096_0899 [Heyndrickxia coagulans]|nr:hypothetical protein B4096_0899 [Heyndrickxia coagulans]